MATQAGHSIPHNVGFASAPLNAQYALTHAAAEAPNELKLLRSTIEPPACDVARYTRYSSTSELRESTCEGQYSAPYKISLSRAHATYPQDLQGHESYCRRLLRTKHPNPLQVLPSKPRRQAIFRGLPFQGPPEILVTEPTGGKKAPACSACLGIRLS